MGLHQAGTDSNIFVLRHILEKCRDKSKDIGLVFIDLEKAYDSVPRKKL